MSAPTLVVSLDLQGELCVRTPAGTSLRLSEELAYRHLVQMLQAAATTQPKTLGFPASPTQWELDKEVAAARFRAQVANGSPSDSVTVRVRKFDRKGREQQPTLTLDDLGL